MHLYMYILCMNIYIHASIRVHVHTCIYTHTYMHLYMYIYILKSSNKSFTSRLYKNIHLKNLKKTQLKRKKTSLGLNI